jgi:hypothetical protein
MCDSFLGEGKEGVSATLHADKPLPANSHSAAPLPKEGIYINKYIYPMFIF